MLRSVLLCLALICANAVSAAEVIVAREARGVAVYIKMPFEDVAPLFGHSVGPFQNYDGAVSYADLSRGTFEAADKLAQDVTFTIDGQTAPFAAMSMMIHPEDTVVPFSDPLDALTAISVCGIPVPTTPPAPEDLVWIAGWYAPGFPDVSDFEMTFPTTGRAPLEVQTTAFWGRGRPVINVHTLQDGGTLSASAPRGLARFLMWH